MQKQRLIEELIHLMDQKYPKDREDFKYIGTGNPDAKILIIGKETSISQDEIEQVDREINTNFYQWKRIISKDAFKVEDWNGQNYSPLYPYKGQKFKINNGINKGTSRTWYNYQKLYNLIYNKIDNPNIDFHEGVFITEVNSSPSPKTEEANIDSIGFRKEIFQYSDFFQSFPVIILAGLGYYEINEGFNEIEKIFRVKFSIKKCSSLKDSQAFWIHRGVTQPTLLINTRQLSINVSDALLEDIAKEIKESGMI